MYFRQLKIEAIIWNFKCQINSYSKLVIPEELLSEINLAHPALHLPLLPFPAKHH